MIKKFLYNLFSTFKTGMTEKIFKDKKNDKKVFYTFCFPHLKQE